jgi:predicted lipid-binding transport protein (Tim44 family)
MSTVALALTSVNDLSTSAMRVSPAPVLGAPILGGGADAVLILALGVLIALAGAVLRALAVVAGALMQSLLSMLKLLAWLIVLAVLLAVVLANGQRGTGGADSQSGVKPTPRPVPTAKATRVKPVRTTSAPRASRRPAPTASRPPTAHPSLAAPPQVRTPVPARLAGSVGARARAGTPR